MKFDIELVGKIGSMALINKETQDINYNIIARISRELDPSFIWVTSGAVEIGRLDYIKRNGKELVGDKNENKADYSAQGQTILMTKYREFLDPRYSLRQILVEHVHFNDEVKREQLKKMLLRAPEQNAVSIINYNDAVCNEENLRFEIEEIASRTGKKQTVGIDNDETAASIATLVKAKTLLILTVADGIYENPEDSSTLVSHIGGKDIYELIDNVEYYKSKCKGASRSGAGGAAAKLKYIQPALQNGTRVIIANAKYSIGDILNGKAPRTLIQADK